MQNITGKRNIITTVILALLFAVVAIVFAMPALSAKAEGNDAGNQSDVNHTDVDIWLELDANGRDGANISDFNDEFGGASTEEKSIEYNNKLHLKSRKLKKSAVIASYNLKHPTDAIGTNTTNYSFDYTNDADNSVKQNSTAFSVSTAESNACLVVTASDTEVTENGRFTIVLKYASADGSGHDRTIRVGVRVKSTLAQVLGANKTSTIVGEFFENIYKDDHSIQVGGTVKSDVENRSDAILTVDNFSEVTVSLDDRLKNRVLRVKKDDKSKNYDTEITANSKFWTVSSVTNLKITEMQLIANNVISTPVIVNPTTVTRISPRVTFTINLTNDAIRDYSDLHYSELDTEDKRVEAFWNDTHNLTLTLDTLSGDGPYTVNIPIVIKPQNPQITTIPSAILGLNVTSKNYLDYSGGKNILLDQNGNAVTTGAESGYNAIIIRPSDLVDYSAPTDFGGIYFVDNPSSKTNENYRVEQLEGETRPQRPSAYKITALKNGSFDITLCVGYHTTVDQTKEETINVTFSINGFGDYVITMPALNGKRAVTYNAIKDEEFSALIADGFQMTGANSLNEEQLNVHYDKATNILTLEPLVDKIDGQTNAAIELEFTNSKSQKVTITTNTFAINVKAGSFWARFEDWQGWLIIAACIIGGIIIVLLVVWLFIHSISKHRQEEAASQAPISSYIVKLNSTIAQTQAQQRLAATQALTQASSQMLLGAGPTSTPAPSPDTLQLSTGMPSVPLTTVITDNTTISEPKTVSEPKETDEDYYALIAKYISDAELLERIFTEKYEPKGMVRRTFFKSKDLQARELEKEKKRIIDRYKSPMPMDEAIMSEKELEKDEQTSAPKEAEAEEPKTEVYVIDLGFDPDAPLYVANEPVVDEFSDEKIDIDISPEQSRLNDLEKRSEILSLELEELKSRLEKVQNEFDRNKTLEEELEAKIAAAEEENAGYAKEIEDLEFKLATAKSKDKDKITRDISVKEEKTQRNEKNIEKWREELESLRNGGTSLNEILIKLGDTQNQKIAEQTALSGDLEKAQADYNAYLSRLEQVRAKQEMEAKIDELSPMLVTVNSADYEIRQLQNISEHLEKEREKLKSEVSIAKSQILGANDFDVINTLNTQISDANARLSEIEKEITKSTRRKSELNVEFNAARRKANDYVEKNEIPLEELIPAEDLVIGNIELDIHKTNIEAERDDAEKRVAEAQAVYDDLTASSADVTMIAMEIASNIKDLEDELAKTQSELDEINAQMESASDDEKLMLMVDQGDKADRVEELSKKIQEAQVEGTKRKMEAQSDYDTKLESARKELDEANEEFKTACAKTDEFINNVNPLDLILSGSGIISQDQKKRDAENLKKQLERSKNEIEQARLAAQMAQMEAEQARIDAERASDDAKAEAERIAQEALEKAEAVRMEAENRLRSESEAADEARRKAEEDAEQAKREAEEAAEQARKEAEEAAEQARREAEEAAEQARKEAEEAIEQARREAEEAAEQAKREAEEAAEQARKEAEEALRAEAEEAKRKAQEEIEEMRRKAEEEAEAKRQEEEAKRQEEEAKRQEEEERQKAENDRKEIIARKVAQRKEQIIGYRNRMKEIATEDDAKQLREQLYSVQLSFDEDERGVVELMDFYNKTMDDIQHEGETAKLKAELAKKPQRVVRKVTERVNRIPKRKPGAKKGSGKPAARRPASARPSGARPRPAGARPGGARPRPSGARPRPSGNRPPRH